MSADALHSETRRDILRAALKRFAHSGYAAASVQQIVDDAEVSKPALYYHFQDKAGLFQALVHDAHDQRLRLMQEAAASAKDFKTQLVEITAASFEFMQKNRELMRLAYSTAFAAPGEVPEGLRHSERCERNFEFVHSLFKKAMADGIVNKRFDSRELAYGYYGQLNAYLVSQLLMPDCRLNRQTAERIVELFFTGAAAKKRSS